MKNERPGDELKNLKMQLRGLQKKLRHLEISSGILCKAELAAGTGSWEMDVFTGRIEASDGARHLYGIKQKTIYFRDIEDIPLPEFRPMIEKRLRDLVENDIPYDVTFKIENKTDKRIIDIHSICEFDKETGKLLGTIQDITKKNQEEKQFRSDTSMLLKITMDVLESTERRKALQIIVKGAIDLIHLDTGSLYTVKDGRIVPEVSIPEMTNIDNLKAELSEHPHIREALETREAVIIRNVNEEQLTDEEKRIATEKNLNSLIFIPLIVLQKPAGIMILGSRGRIAESGNRETDISFTLSNIGSLALENSLLSAQYRMLSRAVEQSPVSIIITNSRGIIEYVNRRTCEITGYSCEELIGKTPGIFKSGHQSEQFYKELWNTIASGKNWEGEMLNRKKNGELHWESVLISPMVDDTGKITHYIGVKEDITEKKASIESLIEARDKAEESMRLKTAFIHNISHEIRTPLNAIVGFTGFLADLNLPREKRTAYSEIIKASSDQLLRIIDSIMRISQIETGKVTVNVSEVRIKKLLTNLFNQYRIIADTKKIRFDLSIPGISEEATIVTDSGKLEQILTNLLDNAFKFTEEGRIVLSAGVSGSNMYFRVADTGIGIPEDEQERIFERFYQTEKSKSVLYGGTGIGLSISQSYADLLGAIITVRSEPGAGSEFTLSIPIQHEELLSSNHSKEERKPN